MKNILSVCLLITSFYAWPDCPKLLSGRWLGSYTDHGPFQGSIPIELRLQTQGDKFSGYTIPNKHAISFSHMDLQGTCTPKAIIFYLNQDPANPKPAASQLSFVNANEISIDLHWQNAMIGGSGPALLEREKSS